MVYLIHFDQPLKHARHYLGFVESDLQQRIDKHKAGTGAKILRAANIAGINWNVVKVWEDGDRNFERSLKNKKKTRCICPVCLKEKKVA
jgi:predicted GIY-YIG superfamily endonuclease